MKKLIGIKFEPIPLLDKVLIAGGISPDEQEALLTGWRTLVRNRLAEQAAHLVKTDLVLDLTKDPENFGEQLEKLTEKIAQIIPLNEAEKILTVTLLSSFLDVVNPLLETVSAEKKEAINQALDKDEAFSALYTAWQTSNQK